MTRTRLHVYVKEDCQMSLASKVLFEQIHVVQILFKNRQTGTVSPK